MPCSETIFEERLTSLEETTARLLFADPSDFLALSAILDSRATLIQDISGAISATGAPRAKAAHVERLNKILQMTASASLRIALAREQVAMAYNALPRTDLLLRSAGASETDDSDQVQSGSLACSG